MEAKEKADMLPAAAPEQNQEPQMLVFGSKSNFEEALRMANCLSSSSIVPTIYRGKEGLPNCLIALEMANRIGASPLMIMQNLYIVHGNPGWSAKFLIASLNSSGKFSPLRYEFKGNEGTDGWSCRAYASDKNGEVLQGSWVSIDMAKKEGWYGKSGSKWQTMPQLMLQYRAAAFFQRTYAPEISMGMHTEDELRDVAVDVPYEDVSEKIATEISEKANKKAIGLEVHPEATRAAASPAPAPAPAPATTASPAPAASPAAAPAPAKKQNAIPF
jgi:hypothetical protein